MITQFKRLPGETEEQFVWRIGRAIDSGATEIDWPEAAAIINQTFRNDESEYRGESAYRKPYQQARRFFESGVFQGYKTEDDYLDEIREEKERLIIEKQKLFDERNSVNRKLRSQSRIESDLSYLRDLILNSAPEWFPNYDIKYIDSNKDMLIGLSDIHIGGNIANTFGTYNSDIAKERLNAYANYIIKKQETEQCQNAYVALLGDLINGNIHTTVRLENREDNIRQTKIAAELITAFIYKIGPYFESVHINSVSGNHSRIGEKDEVLRQERLDAIIPWYMEAALNDLDNIVFDDLLNYDSTISSLDIRGKEYLMVHGDFDKFSESGVAKLALFVGHKPYAVLYGHLHHCSFDDVSCVNMLRGGSLAGPIENFSIERRIVGRASQMIAILDNGEIDEFCPVNF